MKATKRHTTASSFSSASDVLMYSVNYMGGKKLAVSIMPISSKPDASTFRPTRTYDSQIGKVYVATFQDRTSADVISDMSWLMINAANGIDDGSLDGFIKSLRVSR